MITHAIDTSNALTLLSAHFLCGFWPLPRRNGRSPLDPPRPCGAGRSACETTLSDILRALYLRIFYLRNPPTPSQLGSFKSRFSTNYCVTARFSRRESTTHNSSPLPPRRIRNRHFEVAKSSKIVKFCQFLRWGS